MIRRSHLMMLCAAASFLAGCASQDGFPSLAPRAVERELSGDPVPPCVDDGTLATAPALPVAALPADDPALAARVASLVAAARDGQRDFDALLPRANQSAGRSGAEGSESWIEAQQDVSRLEAARARTVGALAELDSITLARSNTATSTADLDRIRAAAEEVRTVSEAQSAALDRLQATLSRR